MVRKKQLLVTLKQTLSASKEFAHTIERISDVLTHIRAMEAQGKPMTREEILKDIDHIMDIIDLLEEGDDNRSG